MLLRGAGKNSSIGRGLVTFLGGAVSANLCPVLIYKGKKAKMYQTGAESLQRCLSFTLIAPFTGLNQFGDTRQPY